MKHRTVLATLKVSAENLCTDAYKAVVKLVMECPYIGKEKLIFNLEAETDEFIRHAEAALNGDRYPDQLNELISRSDPRLLYCTDRRLADMYMLLCVQPPLSAWPLEEFPPQQPLVPVLVQGWRHLQNLGSTPSLWSGE